MTYNAYIHQLNDIKQQLKDNDQELQVMEVKNENAKVAEEMQAKKVQQIANKLLNDREMKMKCFISTSLIHVLSYDTNLLCCLQLAEWFLGVALSGVWLSVTL